MHAHKIRREIQESKKGKQTKNPKTQTLKQLSDEFLEVFQGWVKCGGGEPFICQSRIFHFIYLFITETISFIAESLYRRN